MEKNSSAILEGLNSEQKQAVTCTNGPVLIVAGAGSGKTRVLTSRIAYILEKGCPADRILSLTFTKKAASEMKERIARMVGERNARKLYMGTFHSVFIRFLREFAESIGYPSDFTIYDTGDSTSLIKTCVKEMGLDDKIYKPKDVLSRISMAKNNLVTAQAYMANSLAIQKDAAAKKPKIAEIYLNYAIKCKKAGVMDFDDILLNMNVLFRDNPAALDAISSRFDYIMVDEYQDTNYSQYLILKKLAQKHNNICVVGDDSQSIYAFRGAKIENILNFKKDYPSNKIFRLEQNYRSTQTIVDAANSIIAKNISKIDKRCFSAGEVGDKIKLINAYTEQEEALLVTSSLSAVQRAEHAEFKDFAILYRTNSQSRAIEESLRKRNIPYVIYSGNSFFERAEIKDMMAYLKLVANINDNESFKRIVNKPARGIGDTTIAALNNAAVANETSLFKAILLSNLETYGLKPAAIAKLRTFASIIADKLTRADKEDAHRLATSLALDSGLIMSFKNDTSIEAQTRLANLEELLNGIKIHIEERHSEIFEEMQADGQVVEGDEFRAEDMPLITINDYLENISLLSAVDKSDEGDDDKVTLMTVHSSKGLEYPYVYVVGMEENLFPSGGFYASEADIEEERRLFYVAVTRAKKAVQLSFATTRMRNGKHESNNPSRFLKEIDNRYISNPGVIESESAISAFKTSSWSSSSSPSWKRQGSNMGSTQVTTKPITTRPIISPKPAPSPKPNFEASSIMDVKLNSRIEHSRFGFGQVIEISGSALDPKAKIHFDDYGEKILLLKYAKLKVL